VKLFVLGKRGSIVRWFEDSVIGFRAAGHDVRCATTRDSRLSRGVDAALLAPRAAWIRHQIERFRPDRIIAILPYPMPGAILREVAGLKGRPPILGWVGDLFSAADQGHADLLDGVAYTDTGLLKLHHAFGFKPPAIYLPHAASPRLGPGPDHADRRQQMVMVANPTPHRQYVVDRIDSPMRLFGPGWTQSPSGRHDIHARRVGTSELRDLYRSHRAVLNIRNESNVLLGLNQRHFDPYLAATPVVSDDQADVVECFEPGAEMLVYRDADGLNEIYARLRREPGFARAIGEKGRRRVLHEHTYQQRLAALLRMA
jgi:spore maturation protein CgeB